MDCQAMTTRVPSDCQAILKRLPTKCQSPAKRLPVHYESTAKWRFARAKGRLLYQIAARDTKWLLAIPNGCSLSQMIARILKFEIKSRCVGKHGGTEDHVAGVLVMNGEERYLLDERDVIPWSLAVRKSDAISFCHPSRTAGIQC
jgi:hypothetical protein